MSDPIDEIKQFFSSTKSLKNKGKDFLQLYKQITDYKKTNKQRSDKLNEPVLRFVQISCDFANQTEFSSIWQLLIDVTSEIINSYGCLHSSNDFQTFDVFFKPLLQEIDADEHSDLYKFLERLLAKMNLGFRIATSEYFRKMFLDAFASNVKRKLKESYDLFRILHIHIPEIITPILAMHQSFLKNPNPEQREIGIRFFVDVLIGNYTVKEDLQLDEFRQCFHEKDSPNQKILIENLSKYLLRKSYITNVLIDDLKQCFEGSNLSPTLLSTLVEQISRAIKECYHATPDGLLNLLFVGCDHHLASVAIQSVETIAYLYRLYYVKDPYPSPTRSRLDIVPRLVLHTAIKHSDLIVRVEAQTKFFENIIFEHYRIEERTRQFFIFAQSNLGDEGIRNFGQLLHIQSELRNLIHRALIKCSSMSERSLTQINTSGEDVTPELDQTEDEDENLNEILQKISEFCFLPKERGVRHLRHWLLKSESKTKETFQTIDSSTTMLFDDESVQLVEDRLASRVSIVFSHEFLEEFPSAAQIYFNEEAELNDDEDEDEDEDENDDEVRRDHQTEKDERQHRSIKQMGKLTKVLRPYFESFMDVEILEKFIEVIDENRPILSTFVFGILSEFGSLLGPGPIKTSLIDRLVQIVIDSINKGDRTTMGKWSLRALVPIVSSNEKQFEHLIVHELFGKTKTSWWLNDGEPSVYRWLLLSHIVSHAPSTRTMFEIVEQIVKVIFRQFPQLKNSVEPTKNFEKVPPEIQMRANQLKFVSRAANSIRIQRYSASLLENDDDEEEQRYETLDLILKFLLKLLKDVFIFEKNEIGRHYLQLRSSIEVLRLLEIREVFHRFSPTDYVELFSAATHQNANVRHRFLQRVLQKVSQFKLSVLFLGLTIAVPNDDEDFQTNQNLKSVMERLYLLASKGSIEAMQRLLPEKSISLMIYLHANNRSLIVEIDRDVIDSIVNSVKSSLKTILQAREKTSKHFHGAIPKLLHSIKHSRVKTDPTDDDLHQRIYLIVDIFQSIFADLSPLEAYDFADTRNNLSGEPLLFASPDFSKLNTKSYLPDFYKEKKVTKRSKLLNDDVEELSDRENESIEIEIDENENEKKKPAERKRKIGPSTRSRKRLSK